MPLQKDPIQVMSKTGNADGLVQVLGHSSKTMHHEAVNASLSTIQCKQVQCTNKGTQACITCGCGEEADKGRRKYCCAAVDVGGGHKVATCGCDDDSKFFPNKPAAADPATVNQCDS